MPFGVKVSTNVFASLLIAVISATLLMVGVYSIGTKKIERHVKKSLPIYQQEDLYYSFAPTVKSAELDNWTDSIILNTAAFKRGANFKEIVNNALNNPQYIHAGASPVESLIKAYSTEEPVVAGNYARYWHGYQVYMKPLLTLYSMSDIRCLNMTLQFALVLLLVLELYKKGGVKLMVPFCSGILLINPISSVLSIQFSNMFYITLISAYILLKKEIYKSPTYFYFFLWIGIATAFFDLLSYPLLGLGINLILFLMLTKNPLITRLKQIISASVLWGIGYFGMWFGKWSVATLITGNNVFQEAFEEASLRVNGEVSWGEAYTYFDVIQQNLSAILKQHVYVLIGIIALWVLFVLISKKYFIKFDLSKTIALLLVGVFPFLWMLVLQNHSMQHVFMVHKLFAITFVALFYILTSLYNKIPEESK